MVAATVGRAASNDQKPNSDTSTWVYVLIALLVLSLIGGVAYYFMTKNKSLNNVGPK